MQQRSVLLGIIKAHVKDMGTITLLFLAIYLIGVPLVGTFVLSISDEAVQFPLDGFALASFYQQTFVASCAIYMLVIGIIFPLMLGLHMSLGVTRREHTVGLLVVASLLSLVFALVWAIMQVLLFPVFDIKAVLTVFTLSLGSYLMSWVIVLGFQFRRVITGILGFVIVGLVGFPINLGIEQFVPETNFFNIEMGIYVYSWIELAGEALLIACFVAIIVLATKRIPIKS